VIYPGSIERVDFGEAGDDKFFIIAEVEKQKTKVEWRALENVRPFIDRRLTLDSPDGVPEQLKAALPVPAKLEGAIVRLTVEYPRAWDTLIDEAALRLYAADTFEFHLIKRPVSEARIRLPADQTVSSLGPLELLDQYMRASQRKPDPDELAALEKLASQIIADEGEGG
jgi:exonuclease SbcD